MLAFPLKPSAYIALVNTISYFAFAILGDRPYNRANVTVQSLRFCTVMSKKTEKECCNHGIKRRIERGIKVNP